MANRVFTSGSVPQRNTTDKMGILNRDYMKRPSGDDDRHASSPDSRAEEFFSRFMERHPRFFLYVGIGLAAVIIVAIIVARLLDKSH
jgi:hypothetical protein